MTGRATQLIISRKEKNFEWRLETPDRLGQSGVNKIGLGCLFGLTKDWRTDAYFAGLHLDYLEKKYWKTTYSMSFPRIRPYEGEIMPMVDLADRDLVQLLCAFRIFKEEVELTLSTRESPTLRENLLPLGVTTMSAGSKTNPGGYAGEEDTLEQFATSRTSAPLPRSEKSSGLEDLILFGRTGTLPTISYALLRPDKELFHKERRPCH